ncbi:EAL domain-containing protein [Aurantiacibacter poecillastricola]|uniref:EAL domain-containing protein n=1 Tax=Aurantiacibacter poecillastricola TaxID=3064385 RepID=UPI00273E5B2D|nr:EAL domain-containing protein [Aurantiacibacter sp. 219JJ12-13]MDP5262195.1 EAL domain-containing protein [Aurantiacibacter sp. 219JJ12-13]
MPVPHQIHDRRRRPDRRRSEPHPVTQDLAEALSNDAVSIVFQPQFRAADSSLAGAEALVRWEHPDHGALAGDSVVAIAQAGGITRRLTRRIARMALEKATSWPEHLRLSLNVTAMDLFDRSFGSDLLALLEETGFPPERLTLEITEQALVADLDRSARRLQGLAETGIHVALDDFGAGFCNFRYLKVLPLHALKLDRTMIDGITEDSRDFAVFRGIVAMAKALKLSVIAEGIETEAQRAVIVEEGCETWQGYLGGKPMDGESFAASCLSREA